MHFVRDSSNQPQTKEDQAVLPTALSGGTPGSSEGHRQSAFVVFVVGGIACFVLRYPCTHMGTCTHTYHGPWPGRVQVGCLVLLPLLWGHLEEHWCDLSEDIFLHTQEGRDLVSPIRRVESKTH